MLKLHAVIVFALAYSTHAVRQHFFFIHLFRVSVIRAFCPCEIRAHFTVLLGV